MRFLCEALYFALSPEYWKSSARAGRQMIAVSKKICPVLCIVMQLQGGPENFNYLI
jgi:hypothetical protein